MPVNELESLLESQNRLPSTKFLSKKDKQKNSLETIRKTIEKQECILQVLSQEMSHLEDRIREGYRSSSSLQVNPFSGISRVVIG